MPLQPGNVTGKYSLTGFGGNVQDRQIEAIDVHPEYNATIYFNDIALLTFNAVIEVTDFVRPCCLWSEEGSSLEALVGRRGITTMPNDTVSG